MTARFNPPPGWPPAPAGWTPPPGWSPDPSWPAPPAGWQLWVDDAQGAAPADDVSRFSKPDPSSAPTTAVPSYQAPGAPGGPGAQGGPQQGAVPPSGPVPTAAWATSSDAPSWQQGPGGPAGPGGPGGPAGPEQGKPGGRQWLIPVIIALVAIGAIIAVLFATGVLGGSDEPEPGRTTSAPTTSSAEPSDDASDDVTDEPSDEPTTDDATDDPTDEPSEEPSGEASGPVAGDGGSRTSPLAPGETAPLGDWTVSFAATNTDAWAEISSSSSSVSDFYEPTEGNSYLMSPLTVTYLGESSEPLYMLDYVFVSSDGVTYKDKCGYAPLPNQLETGQELYTDATVTGNVCVTVPTDKIDGGVWRVSGWDRVNKDTEAFFALS